MAGVPHSRLVGWLEIPIIPSLLPRYGEFSNICGSPTWKISTHMICGNKGICKVSDGACLNMSQTLYLLNPQQCSCWRIWCLRLWKGWPIFHQELDHWQVASFRSHMQGIPAQVDQCTVTLECTYSISNHSFQRGRMVRSNKLQFWISPFLLVFLCLNNIRSPEWFPTLHASTPKKVMQDWT